MDDTPTATPAALATIMAESAALDFDMSCQPRTGALLATLAASKPGGRILELGTGTGAGSAWLLDGMTADATLTTVEIDHALQAVAVRHLGHDPRATFEVADAHTWMTTYKGEPFDLAFVDCRPGKFHQLQTLLRLLRVGALYIVDDLLPQPTWPVDHQTRVDQFLTDLPEVTGLRTTAMAWASGLVVGTRL